MPIDYFSLHLHHTHSSIPLNPIPVGWADIMSVGRPSGLSDGLIDCHRLGDSRDTILFYRKHRLFGNEATQVFFVINQSNISYPWYNKATSQVINVIQTTLN